MRTIPSAECAGRVVRSSGETNPDRLSKARCLGPRSWVSRQKVSAFGDNRLYALNLVASELSHSTQPLVPEKLVMLGGDGQGAPHAGVFQAMMQLLTAWDALKEEAPVVEVEKIDPPKAA